MRTQIIIGSLIAIIAILSISQIPIQADVEEDLFDLISQLETENTELVLENDALQQRLTSASHKMVTEHFKKMDARGGLTYLLDFVTEEQKQTALDIAHKDSASKYWEKRSQN